LLRIVTGAAGRALTHFLCPTQHPARHASGPRLVSIAEGLCNALQDQLPPWKEIIMRKWLAHRMLHRFGKHYNYDIRYIEALVTDAPDAFFRFSKVYAIANYRKVVPREAAFTAKLVGALHEDCGPCSQLVVDMALEAGVPKAQIEAVLRHDVPAMSKATALGFRFAIAVANRTADEDDAREAVRTEWGNQGVIELTFAVQVSRVYPMVKAGLGFAKECRRVVVEGHTVDVKKAA
jgi:hypothetical protein